MIILKLLLKNAFRHKLRTLLTIAGLAVAILAFGLLRILVNAWYTGVEASASNRLITRNAISLAFPLPLYYGEKMSKVPGVARVSFGTWFGGIYIDEKNFFANFAVEPKSYLDVVPEVLLAPGERAAFISERRSALAGRKLAERFKWKAGDTVTLKGTIFPGNWDFIIKGIYRGRDETTDETMFVFNWNYLNETLKKTAPSRADQVGLYFIKIKNPHDAGAVSLAVDSMFRNSFAETLTETEKAFQMSFISMTSALITAIQIVSFIVIFIIMAVMANTMAMSVRERSREYAVFKTLGFGPLSVCLLIMGESLVIASAGGALGVLATFPASRAVSEGLGQYFPVFFVSRDIILQDAAAAIAIGVLAAILPAWRASSTNIIKALGRLG